MMSGVKPARTLTLTLTLSLTLTLTLTLSLILTLTLAPKAHDDVRVGLTNRDFR